MLLTTLCGTFKKRSKLPLFKILWSPSLLGIAKNAKAQIYILRMRGGCALDHFMGSIALAATLAGSPPPLQTLSHPPFL